MPTIEEAEQMAKLRAEQEEAHWKVQNAIMDLIWPPPPEPTPVAQRADREDADAVER